MKIARLNALVLLLVALTALPAYAAPAERSSAPLMMFSDFSVVDGSESTLVRNDSGVRFNLRTSEIPGGAAITIWWVVFNNPGACVDGCGADDLFREGVGTSVHYGAGNVVGNSGGAAFAASLNVQDTSAVLFGPGLMSPRGAEVHLVVRSHGEAIPDLVSSQISTFLGGCVNTTPIPDSHPLRGEPGPNTCSDLQFAIHQA